MIATRHSTTRQHKDFANISAAQTTQKCQKGKQISIKGQLHYPQEGRTAQATDRKHPNHDMFNDGRESEETALCSVGRTKSAGSPTSRASPEQLMRRHSPRHAAPAPTTQQPQAKMTQRQPTCKSTDIAAHLGLPYAKKKHLGQGLTSAYCGAHPRMRPAQPCFAGSTAGDFNPRGYSIGLLRGA